MARIDDLVAQILDKELRRKVEKTLSDMKRRQRFGLVYEEHVPETTTLFNFPLQVGATVQRRSDVEGKNLYTVKAVNRRNAIVELESGGEPETSIPKADLLVVKRFGDPIFPTLTRVGQLTKGAPERHHHAVINGENFHTLQLLVYLYGGQVDCIYIDPPYNTGARDWKYNNHYVDENDAWRHSKWLSFMEKRLRLAKKLLRSDGVLIVTIDEHEVHHLGLLLEKLFPEYLRYTISAVINPKGTFKQNFGRVEEQIFFIVPNLGHDVINPKPVTAGDDHNGDGQQVAFVQSLISMGALAVKKIDRTLLTIEEQDLLAQAEEANGAVADTEEERAPTESLDYEEWFLRRRGQQSSYRHQRPNQFYSILVDTEEKRVLGIGPALKKDASYKPLKKGSMLTVYPIDNEGHERVWRYSRETMQRYIDAGEIVVGRFNAKTKSWTLNHRKLKKEVRRHKTVWWEKSHDAGVHGTNVLNNLLGKRGLFPFPKSVYAVQDALSAVVRSRPDALILDFFAGSGTTFHATCLLNAEDGGRRRSVLITNNEVEEKIARELQADGYFRGDKEFERHGIFSLVTRPRCEAVVTGRRPTGEIVPGKHINGRPFALGFAENVSFFRVEYVESDDVELGFRFDSIHPSLWLAAGGIGKMERIPDATEMVFPPGAPYAVLIREERFHQFLKKLARRNDITHVWIVTDSQEAFAEMKAALPGQIACSMLYSDFLRNFRINTRNNL
jgi:adenine-specific DNA-methyltransferase